MASIPLFQASSELTVAALQHHIPVHEAVLQYNILMYRYVVLQLGRSWKHDLRPQYCSELLLENRKDSVWM